MRIERRIILTKKEMEAIKIVFEMFDKNGCDLFESTDDFMDFINDVVKYNQFQDFVIEKEN